MVRMMIQIVLCMLSFTSTLLAQPSLEDAKSLPAGVFGATSSVSDGYGQHMITISNGTVNHYLIGNNGEEIAGYTQNVATGEYPSITSFGGKLRVTMKQGSQIIIYQSLNGGASWAFFAQYTPQDPPGTPVPIFDLDAYSDNNGTHITWASASTSLGDAEVYYVRYRDDFNPDFVNFKNVTDLSQMQQGGRPKVVATASEVHVQFVGSNLQMHSRDLDLAMGNWDNNYIISSVATTNAVSSTTVSGNRIFCLIAQAPGQNSPQPQNFYLVSRAPADQNWSSPQYVTTTTSGIGEGYMRNTIVASPSNASVSKVYVATTCNTQSGCADQVGITLRTYSSTGLFEVAEPIYSGNTNASLVFLSASRFGAYAYWPGSMRRKPFLIGGTISERTLLTGNNWVDYFIVDANTTLDAMPFSQTDFIGGSGSQVNGVLNAYEAAKFRFAGGGRIFVYGRLFTYGSEAKKVVFTAIDPSAPWQAVFIQTNGGFCSIGHADISYGGLDIRSSRVVLTDSRIHHTPYLGLFLFNMIHPKNSIVIERTRIDHHNYQNESGWGVIMQNAWNVTLSNSSIDSCFYSLDLENSRPRLYGNRIYDNENGMFAWTGSDPRFGDRTIGDYGYNCITHNINWELYASGSTTFLGLNTQNGVMGGFNSLDKQGLPGGLVYAATDPVYGDSYVEAERNWWGSDPPDPSKFNTSGNSKIDYTYWLPSTTCGGSGSRSLSE